MNFTAYELVIVVLVALVMILAAAQVLLSVKSGENSKVQYPPDTLDRVESLLALGFKLAGVTSTKIDDEGLKIAAEALGFKVEMGADGTMILKRPPVVSPPAAAG